VKVGEIIMAWKDVLYKKNIIEISNYNFYIWAIGTKFVLILKNYLEEFPNCKYSHHSSVVL